MKLTRVKKKYVVIFFVGRTLAGPNQRMLPSRRRKVLRTDAKRSSLPLNKFLISAGLTRIQRGAVITLVRHLKGFHVLLRSQRALAMRLRNFRISAFSVYLCADLFICIYIARTEWRAKRAALNFKLCLNFTSVRDASGKLRTCNVCEWIPDKI